MKRAVFPGSFDPITLGHEDIILRGLPIFDEIVIAIGKNSEKKYMFSEAQRIGFLKSVFKQHSKIRITTYSGLTTDFCKKIEADFILRGLRNPADFEFEKAIAHTNRTLSGIETLFFLTAAKTSYISSSIVRDVIRNGGDYSPLVPKNLSLR